MGGMCVPSVYVSLRYDALCQMPNTPAGGIDVSRDLAVGRSPRLKGLPALFNRRRRQEGERRH